MLKKNFTFFTFLRITVFVINVWVFVWLTRDVWNKFRLKTTTTGIRFRVFESEQKPLPCFTFCASEAYKTAGLHFTSKQFVENTFDLEDFFEDETMVEIKNSSLYSLTQTWSVYLGRCHTLCYIPAVGLELTSLYLKKSLDLKMFIHNRGEEFWTTLSHFPVDQAILHFEFAPHIKTRVILNGMTTKEKTFLPNENLPCQSYSEDFVKLCKPLIWNKFKTRMNCSVAPLKEFALDLLPECSDLESAVNAY